MIVGKVELVDSLVANRIASYTSFIVISRPSLLNSRESQGFKG